MSDERYVGNSLLFFLAGAAVGATIAVLTTPKTGPELRGDIKGLGQRVRDRFASSRPFERERDRDHDMVGA
ncbi:MULTISPECIES: YtxH domain-containing protein [Geothrix]|uniref:YtxH domain-containing protein n=1 Tax=Geothrix TaxID=44675 RepID=UPI001FAE5CBD|nr:MULTISPECIES: YtxH domain-containing protein [Geothrix]